MRKKFFVVMILALALAVQVFAGERFHFAIIGDITNNPNQKVFRQVISEITQLHPDFVINVGDLIQGYTGDTNTINAEWDTVLNTLKKFACPIYLVPGNHDIQDTKSRELYQERTKAKPYYSFDFKGSHFMIMDNSTIETWEQIDKKQLGWAKKELSKKRKGNVFCFFHKPFWMDALTSNQQDMMHKIFGEAGVTYVISGHNHLYTRTNLDGISYNIVGSSGGEIEGNEALGALYGYAWVTVEGRDVDITYIKLGNVVPEDALTFEGRKELLKIEEECVSVDSMVIADGAELEKYKINVKIKNVLDEDFTESFKWKTPENVWKVSPAETTCTFKKGELTTLSFGLINSSPDKLFPVPVFELIYPHKGWGEYKIAAPVKIFRKAKVTRAEVSPKIDGRLDDKCWVKKGTLRKLCRSGGEATKVEPTDIYLTYDKDNLYIGVRCKEKELGKIKAETNERDGSGILSDDCVLIYIDTDTKDYKMHQVIVNANGTILDQFVEFKDSNVQRHREWQGDWRVATGRENDAWTLEVGVPFEMFGASVESGTEWGFNIGRMQQRVADNATWQQMLTIEPKYFGRILFE